MPLIGVFGNNDQFEKEELINESKKFFSISCLIALRSSANFASDTLEICLLLLYPDIYSHMSNLLWQT